MCIYKCFFSVMIDQQACQVSKTKSVLFHLCLFCLPSAGGSLTKVRALRLSEFFGLCSLSQALVWTEPVRAVSLLSLATLAQPWWRSGGVRLARRRPQGTSFCLHMGMCWSWQLLFRLKVGRSGWKHFHCVAQGPFLKFGITIILLPF